MRLNLPPPEMVSQTIERTVLRNREFIPQLPNGKQQVFLTLPHNEAFYGGAAGGAKSSSLLTAALQYVHEPEYAALLLRRTYADLSLPGALMDRANQWLRGTRARWSDKEKTWHFPAGSTLTFGYLENENDKYRYQSSELQFIGFDELSQFTETQYTYLFSRCRRKLSSSVPIRTRSGSNPGGAGHAWCKKRFIPDSYLQADEETRFANIWQKDDRPFVPARLADNKHIDLVAYEESLAKLDPVTRQQLLHGDWRDFEGGRFKRAWFGRWEYVVDTYFLNASRTHGFPKRDCLIIVTLDPAASEKQTADYTAMGAWAVTPAQDILLLDVVRERMAVDRIIPRLDEFCARHGPSVVGIEATGFQQALVRQAMDKQRFRHIPTVLELHPHGKGKLARATPAIIRAERGQLYLPNRADWLDAYESEMALFTGDPKLDSHDDVVDMTSYAVEMVDRYHVSVASPGIVAFSVGERPNVFG